MNVSFLWYMYSDVFPDIPIIYVLLENRHPPYISIVCDLYFAYILYPIKE